MNTINSLQQFATKIALRSKIPHQVIPSLSKQELQQIMNDKVFSSFREKIIQDMKKDSLFYQIFKPVNEYYHSQFVDPDSVEFHKKEDHFSYSPISFVTQMKDEDDNGFQSVINHTMSKEQQIIVLQQFYKDKQLFTQEELEYQNPLNEKGKFGRTKLHEAVLTGTLDEVKNLISQGAQVRAKDNSGYTPLILARLNGKKEIAEYLKGM